MHTQAVGIEHYLLMTTRQPTAIIVANLLILPLDGLLGGRPEEPGIFETAHRRVMIAHNRGNPPLANDVHHLIGVGIVTRQIAQTDDAVRFPIVYPLKDSLGRFEIRVKIRYYRN